MKERAQRWREVRARGLRAYVLRRGVLGWGVPMAAIFGGLQALQHPDRKLHFILVNIPIWLAAGVVLGVATWYTMEWLHRHFLDKVKRQDK